MDFVINLLINILFEGVEHNILLVIVNCFTKMGYFIPIWKDITTK